MRKLFLVLFVVTSLACAGQGLDFLQTGEYAWYRDERGADTYLRGYWYLGTSKGAHVLMARTVALADGSERRYSISLTEKSGGGFDLGALRGVGSDEAPGQFQAIVDALNFANLRAAHDAEIGWETVVDDHWGEKDPPYTLHFDMGLAVPLFGFLGIRYEDDAEPSYRLVSAGYLPLDGDRAVFLERLPVETEAVVLPGAPPTLGSGELRELRLGAWTLVLDASWKKHVERGYQGYWLSPRTSRDSQISVESMPASLGGSPRSQAGRFLKTMLLIYDGVIDFGTVRFDERDDLVTLCFSLSDERGVRNVQAFVVKFEDGKLCVLNVSSFEDIWLANKEYYERILSSAR